MAIKDTSRKPYIQDNDDKVKIGIDLPIRRDDASGGFFASTTTTIEAVKNNIRNLLQTEEGERFFQPNLGINLKRKLFENLKEGDITDIQNTILDKFDFWLPFVETRDIQILTNSDDTTIGVNTIIIKIIFNIKQDPNTLESVILPITLDGSDDSTASSVRGYKMEINYANIW